MLRDLVVDTNVLMHADDDRQSHQQDAYGLLQDLLEGSTALCVDNGFDLNEAKNKSLIGGEYLERLTGASIGMQVVAHLFGTGRVRFVSKAVPKAVKQTIEQCVRNKRDRTFLAVAHNSDDRILCSHDLKDLQRRKRKDLKAKTGVAILLVADTRAAM